MTTQPRWRGRRGLWRRLSRPLAAWRDERGSALVEFAVSLPLLVTMLAAGTGTVLVVQARFAVQAAAREAATIGAYTSTTIDPYNTAITDARAGAERVLTDYGLDLTRAVISFEGTSTDLERSSLFQVHIEYTVRIPVPLANFMSNGGGVDFIVRSVSVVPVQQYKARWPCPSSDPICN